MRLLILRASFLLRHLCRLLLLTKAKGFGRGPLLSPRVFNNASYFRTMGSFLATMPGDVPTELLHILMFLVTVETKKSQKKVDFFQLVVLSRTPLDIVWRFQYWELDLGKNSGSSLNPQGI